MNIDDANNDGENDAGKDAGKDAAGTIRCADEPAAVKERDKAETGDAEAKANRPSQSLLNRFVKSKTVVDDVKRNAIEIIHKPAHIDDAARVLLLEPDEMLTVQSVHAAWRRLICLPDVHPYLGGNAERAILINLAKDQLIRWIESNQPKLGKLFQR